MSDNAPFHVPAALEKLADATDELESTWKDAPRSWGHSLHRLAPYIGGFPASLSHYFIQRFTETGDIVLDPFCGGGTTPLEAGLQNRIGWGNDAFSYAYTLSSAKCNPLKDREFEEYLSDITQQLTQVDNTNMSLLDNEDAAIFFSDYTLDQLLRLRKLIKNEQSTRALYLKAIICGVLHGPSDMYLSLQTKDAYSGSPNYVEGYAEEHGLECPTVDIQPKAKQKHSLATADGIPSGLAERTTITNDDARDMEFDEESADLILTSPPYMAKIQYTYNNWLRLWWLGKEVSDERDQIDITADTDRYRSFMSQCLSEMYDILAPDSFCILIVGDVKKRLASGTKIINTATFIAETAEKDTQFQTHGIIKDAYDVEDRSYVVSNQAKYDTDDDAETIDRCLILKKGDPDIPTDPKIDWNR